MCEIYKEDIALAIPTYNATDKFKEVLQKIEGQKDSIGKVFVLDSGSSDSTVIIADSFDFEVETIHNSLFNHAGTRTMISKKMYDQGFKYLIFLTQDVYLLPNALDNLIHFIGEHPNMGVAKGKQIVDSNKGNIFEEFSRNSNYGDKEQIFSKQDIEKHGVDTIYTSDAFCIYNLNHLEKVDWFGENLNMSEDMFVAHKLIQCDFEIGYTPKAKVYHTHNFSIKEEFGRYKKIGIFYKENQYFLKEYKNTTSKGMKLAVNEIKYLYSKKKLYKLPESIFRNFVKFLAFQIGKYSM